MKIHDEGVPSMGPDDWERIFSAIQKDTVERTMPRESKPPIPSRLPGPMVTVQLVGAEFRLRIFRGVYSNLWYLVRLPRLHRGKQQEPQTYAARYTTWEHARDAAVVTLQTGVFLGHPMKHFQNPLMIVPPSDQPGA